MKITIGTRGSKLALWQTEFVQAKLKAVAPEIEFEVKIIKTKGDEITDAALSQIGDKGLFTQRIEEAILDQEVDIAVHSLKDLPTKLPDGLILGCVLEREQVQDVFISKNQVKLKKLPKNAVIATGSLRRKAQLLHFRRDLQIIDLRGNIDTRFRKFDAGTMDGMVLAYAGVARMNYGSRITENIPINLIMPAVGQGAVAIEIRAQDPKVWTLVRKINHGPTELAVTAERALLHKLEGGCHIPIGALAELVDGKLKLQAIISNLDGTQMIRDYLEGEPERAGLIGLRLAQRLLEQGGDKILAELNAKS